MINKSIFFLIIQSTKKKEIKKFKTKAKKVRSQLIKENINELNKVVSILKITKPEGQKI